MARKTQNAVEVWDEAVAKATDNSWDYTARTRTQQDLDDVPGGDADEENDR